MRKLGDKRRERERMKHNHGCSLRVWETAKRRNATFFGNHLWLVEGGEKQHVVYVGPDRAVCDCPNWERAYNQTCCHIQTVKNTVLAIVEGKY